MSPRSVLPCTRSSPARNNSLNAFRAKELSPSPVSYGTKPRGCERVHTLSRSPVGSQVAAKCAIRRARVLRSSITLVSFPRRRGCERVHTLSRSPVGSQDAAKCAKRCCARSRNFESTRFSPASPGVREGSHPLALSHGVARLGRVRHTLPRASSGFRLLRFFPALLGVREGSHPLALSHGVVSRSRELQSIPLL